MANVKISDLTAYTDAASTDILPIVDIGNDVTKKITIGDVVKAVPLGTAALPGLAFDGDPNSGVYSPGADQVAISTNGTGRLFVDSTGSLTVTKGGTSGQIALFQAFNGYAEFKSTRGTGGSYTRISGTYAGNPTDYWSIGSNGFTDGSFAIWAGAGNAERLRIDSSGRLLVGTSSAPSGIDTTLVLSGNSGGATANPTILFARNNFPNPGLNADLGRIGFGNANYAGAQITGHGDGTWTSGTSHPTRLVFSTTADGASSPTERMRITSTGQVRLAGAGITFNGDTAAANELDDYEEGTFTPTLTSTNADTVVGSYQIRTGIYTKVGNLVTISIYLATNVTTAGTGNVIITGLPFTSSATNLSALSLSAVGRWTTQGPLAAGIGSNSTTIDLGETDSAVDPNLATSLSTTRLTTAANTKNLMLLSGFYRV